MQHLIPITRTEIDKTNVPTVNARHLHQFLEVKRDFSNWIKDRIEQYDFEEDKDYVEVFQQMMKNPFDDFCSPELASKDSRGGHNRKDYQLSVDMAKELSMVERNAKGKQARQYLDGEKRRGR